MTVWESVGLSHYGALAGVEQFMQRYAARRIKHLIDLVATEPGCRRMTVNEGRRSRARQLFLYDLMLHHGGNLAAVPFTSRHDEVTHGNAADLGGPNGEVLNAAEQAAIHKYADQVGILYTGPGFNPPEIWHVEALTSRYSYAPTTSLAGIILGALKPTPKPKDLDMPALVKNTAKTGAYHGFEGVLANGTLRHFTTPGKLGRIQKSGLPLLKVNGDAALIELCHAHNVGLAQIKAVMAAKGEALATNPEVVK